VTAQVFEDILEFVGEQGKHEAGAETSAERAVVEQRAGAVVAQFENTPSS
jgi:hypothetical protein